MTYSKFSMFFSEHGVYLHLHKEGMRPRGVICWSKQQTVETAKAWKISPADALGIFCMLKESPLPVSDPRQPIMLEGSITCGIEQLFEKILMVNEICPTHERVLDPLPRGTIHCSMVSRSQEKAEAMGIFYTDPNGEPCLVIFTTQRQGLMCLSHSWMLKSQMTSLKQDMMHLERGEDDLNVPTLIKGPLVQLIILEQKHYESHFPNVQPNQYE